MKLATLQDGTRDGCLVVVSRDNRRAIRASSVARTLQDALDDWATSQPALQRLSLSLDSDHPAGMFDFDSRACMAPLPRAQQWIDGSAYLNHVELVRKARGADMPPSFLSDPLMYQGTGSPFLAPHAPLPLVDESWGLDLESEVAVITTDIPAMASASLCENHIALLVLVNDVTLRHLIPDEIAKGFGFFQSKPPCAMSPLAITPDECGDAWDGRKLSLPLLTHRNDHCIGHPNAGIDLQFDFPTLLAHAARTRPLPAGTVLGSGTVSNRDPATGSSCIAEIRVKEILARGIATTPFLQSGERIRIEMLLAEGHSLFGAIEQDIIRVDGRRSS
jgi:fumarylacetoacetate (FAA) hydrolase